MDTVEKWDNTSFTVPFTFLNVGLVNHIGSPSYNFKPRKCARSLEGTTLVQGNDYW
ncbi:hypothetical protein FRC0263_01185 [Corynebacterium diphtheriae]|nr:hypothetical protein FRC0263_01185 [Corynebacterium diphtheriae]